MAADTVSGEFKSNLDTAQLGLWCFLGTVTMLFAAFVSALLVRRAGSDWQPLAFPPLLWFNTCVLLLSSVSLRIAENHNRGSRANRVALWVILSLALGILFLSGQLLVWRQLASRGIYLPTNPHSSFFYILTGLHGVHLCGGIVALCYVVFKHRQLAAARVLQIAAPYWHFLSLLWIPLFLILSF